MPHKSERALAPEEQLSPIPPALWLDPDLRWLTGTHEAEGHSYIVREQYEELLWWLQLPSLLKLAIQPSPDRAAVEQLGAAIQSAMSSIEAAGYRIDQWIAPPAKVEPLEDRPLDQEPRIKNGIVILIEHRE